MNGDPQPRNVGGRPPVPAERRRVLVTMRVLPELKEKLLRLGRARLEQWVAKAPEPK
jgi:hypothetical protein